MFDYSHKAQMVSPEQALPGRAEPLVVNNRHLATDHPLKAPFPDGMHQIILGMGCFWGAERLFWTQPGVYSTAVGYAGGYTENPTYEEVCSGLTGHTEVVLVVFDPDVIGLTTLLELFWVSHDPTQGMRQGNDRGTQYRSAIYCFNEAQYQLADKSREAFQRELQQRDFPPITTEISLSCPFYYAEDYHQQYLIKNPGGYCSLKGTGVTFRLDQPE
ncbi:peptide-methionine (S)-S-oxide reductase MsrA [Porticoccus sp.]|uniref:peptide-methionine (S)-S-oxide reductase MsrA n=1 Tax=Porticoccus sp. TaxID=2024853 RepID=UPI003F697C99